MEAFMNNKRHWVFALMFCVMVVSCAAGQSFTARYNEARESNLPNDWNVWASFAASTNSLEAFIARYN